jgi:hypothetical protein
VGCWQSFLLNFLFLIEGIRKKNYANEKSIHLNAFFIYYGKGGWKIMNKIIIVIKDNDQAIQGFQWCIVNKM